MGVLETNIVKRQAPPTPDLALFLPRQALGPLPPRLCFCVSPFPPLPFPLSQINSGLGPIRYGRPQRSLSSCIYLTNVFIKVLITSQILGACDLLSVVKLWIGEKDLCLSRKLPEPFLPFPSIWMVEAIGRGFCWVSLYRWLYGLIHTY